MGCNISTKFKKRQVTQQHHMIKAIQQIKLHPGHFVQQNQNKFQDIYRIGRVLRNNTFGQVRICFHRSTGNKRAVKIFRKDLMTSEISRVGQQKQIGILKSLDHPNIIRIYQFFQDVNKLYTIMQYCEGGELFNAILKQPEFSQQNAAMIMRQLFSAVTYLHKFNIVHRDIKAQNILLQEKDSIYNIKLIDFSSATCSRGNLMAGMYGTSYYIAPEVLSSEYTDKCDVWSCGVLLYLLLSGHPPFSGEQDQQIFDKIKLGEYSMKGNQWQKISESAKSLIQAILVPEHNRISASEALQHPWILSFGNTSKATQEELHSVLGNLRSFYAPNKLRDAVQTFLSTQYISNKDLKQLKKAFRSIDKNGDGQLSRQELIEAYTQIMGAAQAEHQANRIMLQVDSDQSGFINYSEFIKSTYNSRNLMSLENLKAAFNVFDVDGSGSISADELRRVLEGGADSNDEVWSKLIEEIDQNGDGEIDLQEFQQLIQSKILV